MDPNSHVSTPETSNEIENNFELEDQVNISQHFENAPQVVNINYIIHSDS